MFAPSIARSCLLIAFGAMIALCASVSLFVIVKSSSNANVFCTPDDVIYQVVSDNAETWMESFPDTYTPLGPHRIPFTIKGNQRTYYAEGDWEGSVAEGRPSLIYVITGPDRRLMGTEGYIYAPTGSPTSDVWENNYWFKRLADHIYCYRLS